MFSAVDQKAAPDRVHSGQGQSEARYGREVWNLRRVLLRVPNRCRDAAPLFARGAGCRTVRVSPEGFLPKKNEEPHHEDHEDHEDHEESHHEDHEDHEESHHEDHEDHEDSRPQEYGDDGDSRPEDHGDSQQKRDYERRDALAGKEAGGGGWVGSLRMERSSR